MAQTSLLVVNMIKPLLLTPVVASILLAACMPTQQVRDQGPSPDQVIAGAAVETPVTWGGRIVQVRNLQERTLIEVVALGLDSDGRPIPGADPQGRFIVERPGFLEPQEYAPDRLVTASGRLQGFTDGKVGDAPYRFPLLLGESLTLWPQHTHLGGRGSPRVGIGVGSGSFGSGVGIGIGF